MAGTAFHLQIYTQAKKVFDSDDVSQVVFPASDGSMGVLANHAPMLAMLGSGDVRVEMASSGDERAFQLAGGFFEVADNRATILADSFEEN